MPGKLKLAEPVDEGTDKEPRFTVYTSPELDNEIRDAVYTLSGPPHMMTISEFFVEAARIHVDRLRRTANNGRPWLKRPAKYRTRRGRPASK